MNYPVVTLYFLKKLNQNIMAKKSVKKSNQKVEKVELTESFNKIKSTASNVTTQVVETATEVIEDVRENGKFWIDETAKTVKETVTNFDVEKTTKAGIKTATKVVKNVNEFALETADDIVDGALNNGKKLQGIAVKAINGGLKITAKQQDIVFVPSSAKL